MVAFKPQKHFDTHWPGEDDYRPASFFPSCLVEPKCWYLKKGRVGWKQGCALLQVAHHNLTWHLYFPNKIDIVWEIGGNGEACVFSSADVAGYNSIRCLSLHIAAAAQHRFTSFFEISNQVTSGSPGLEHENLDRPKPGMLIPNMFCTFVQIPHHFLVPFLHAKSMTFPCGLLESIYTTTRLIYPNCQGSNLIAFQGSKIIVVMILEPSTATSGGGILDTSILRVSLIWVNHACWIIPPIVTGW